ncbi:hypothetical protein [Streptomyces sp. NPDC056061]|uniref:hypothetical protein n=1 Tax=Streptomyces sp. NPDC056061 TaxID=3345700 RepID=UPI0035E19CFA
MTGTGGTARQPRLHRLAGAVVLLAPLPVAGAASAPPDAPRTAAVADDTPADAGRIAFAGTGHRSLGAASDAANPELSPDGRTVTVTNRGPAPSPGTVLTADPPPGVHLDGITTPAGSCSTGSPQCGLGVLAPDQSVDVTVRLTGVTPGDQRISRSVAGSVLDPVTTPFLVVGGTVVPPDEVGRR